ncbi:hypothetical protein HZB02_02330 [Candidatus Woesearchaeota archaeon]|nr:hypothetical protein [Candidatus Woesearchaeota archaeon]
MVVYETLTLGEVVKRALRTTVLIGLTGVAAYYYGSTQGMLAQKEKQVDVFYNHLDTYVEQQMPSRRGILYDYHDHRFAPYRVDMNCAVPLMSLGLENKAK